MPTVRATAEVAVLKPSFPANIPDSRHVEPPPYFRSLLPTQGIATIAMTRGGSHTVVIEGVVRHLLNATDNSGEKPAAAKVCLVCPDRETRAVMDRAVPEEVASGRLMIVLPPTAGTTNWRTPEGRAALGQCAEKADALVLMISDVGLKVVPSPSDIPLLIQALQERAPTLVLLAKGLTADGTEALAASANAALEVRPCEPDTDFGYAHLVAPAPGTMLAATGMKPVVENIRATADGLIERHIYEAVSPDAVTRQIVRMSREGMTLSRIGQALGLDKSTIKRRIDKVRHDPKNGFVIE